MRTTQISLSDNLFRLVAETSETLARARRGSAAAKGREAAGPATTAPRLGWLRRLERWLERQEQRRVEEYLAQSQDVFELEARIRDLQRGNSSRCC